MSMPTITRARYSKYRRIADTPNIAVTNDDDQILLEVYRHDIIDANTICTLLALRSIDKVRRRLRKLHLNQYLQRLAQIEQIHVPGGGSLPVAYTLGVKGAKHLTEAYGLVAKPDRYRDRGKTLSSQHVLHALEQTRFLVSCRKSAQARDHLEFLYPDQIYTRFAPEILKRDTLPSVVSARVNWHGYSETEGTIPDGFFMLRYKNLPDGRNRRALFLEIDRGTETIDVSDRKLKTLKFWKDTSLLRKFVVYSYAFAGRTHERAFGVPTFQVLTVTTNRDRVGKMQEMYRKRLAVRPHSVKPYRFLFTDLQTIFSHEGDILAVPFEDGEGKVREML
jgi:hypothetical protein